MMIDPSKIDASDGEYQILYSSDFNIYQNKLTIKGILDLIFEFTFEKRPNSPKPHFEAKMEGKKIIIDLFNFSQNFGAATTDILPIASVSDGGTLYFSIHTKSVSETTNFLQVALTFYLK